jgi:hypothetical protein
MIKASDARGLRIAIYKLPSNEMSVELTLHPLRMEIKVDSNASHIELFNMICKEFEELHKRDIELR